MKIYYSYEKNSVGPKTEDLRLMVKDLRLQWPKLEAIPTAEGLICSFLISFSKMEAEMCFSLHRCHFRLN